MQFCYYVPVILNVYKEKGWTSFDVVAKLKNILKVKKVGHAGTLDPLAEGVLVVLTDKDTKKQNEVMKTDKEYKALIAFGAKSPTYDLEGELSFYDVGDSKNIFQKVEKILPKYVGNLEQTVPPYSAKKAGGKKLYRKARSGEKLELADLPKNKIDIFNIKVNEFKEITVKGNVLPAVDLTIVCSHGTYIRSLAHDLGHDLGVGGVLVGLVRTRVGNFRVEDSKKISEF